MPQKSAECRHGMHRWVLGTDSYGPHIGMAHIVITHMVMVYIVMALYSYDPSVSHHRQPNYTGP